MKNIVVFAMASFAAAGLTLFLLGSFDVEKVSAPIQVEMSDCHAKIQACGSSHKCWAQYHECIGAGQPGDSI